MLWYSGYLDYDYELVKTSDETVFIDVCMIRHSLNELTDFNFEMFRIR
jgi:hypothetical protein